MIAYVSLGLYMSGYRKVIKVRLTLGPGLQTQTCLDMSTAISKASKNPRRRVGFIARHYAG